MVFFLMLVLWPTIIYPCVLFIVLTLSLVDNKSILWKVYKECRDIHYVENQVSQQIVLLLHS